MVVAILLMVSQIVSSQVAYAESVNSVVIEIQPVGSACVGTAEVKFSISQKGVAKSVATVRGKAGTSKIVMKINLQKYDNNAKKWMNVKTWETSSQTAIVSCSKNYPLSKKGTYRCKIAATVICNGKTEKVSKTSGSVKASMKELGSMAKGLHALCGYSTGVYLTSDMGAVMTAKLKRGVSVKEAFFATAKETQTWKSKLKSRQACVFTTKKCANDRIWGYGSVASDPKDYNKDPSGYVKYCYNL